ncbi:response regulator transcription factor [Dechloromonas sp. XY25]|uniref:Response regulator transcription factor n=1 Tax=Dechloromonas hankyongensis TaxID=2908002 RepID=A0ABS9K762_9RHOO|nr:response regulator transcription factor [Dechloromonas hankyongensis]MCG2579004.1 response regulator transcription factor [Dechloromonas hankyongensis]
MIRILLVDDHAVVREGYRRLLERRADLHIEAEAASAEEALQRLREIETDLIILDLSLPNMGGIELTRRILQRQPDARILAFSMHRDPLFAAQAIRAGALGYVTKSSGTEVLIQAVYKVARREKVLSPDIAPEMALSLLQGESNPAEELSPREFEILRLLLDGLGVEEIGNILNISPKTVQNGHYQIKAKLGVKTDIELARLAMKLKLID